MFCTNCGEQALQDAKFCTKCGLSMVPQQDAAQQEFEPVNAGFHTQNKVRPWARFWARVIDIILFSFVTGFITEAIAPGFLETTNDIAFGVIWLFVFIFVESLLLSSFQTTPGKFLFKIKVSLASGEPISIWHALERSFNVWWRGLGAGLPIVYLITMSIAYNRLKKNGITSWDKDSGFSITHGN